MNPIKEYRKARKITQEQFGNLFNPKLTQVDIHRIEKRLESGIGLPPHTAKLISETLYLDLYMLLFPNNGGGKRDAA